jgi:hypothetical protein
MSTSDQGGCNPDTVYEESLALGMDRNPKFCERKEQFFDEFGLVHSVTSFRSRFLLVPSRTQNISYLKIVKYAEIS